MTGHVHCCTISTPWAASHPLPAIIGTNVINNHYTILVHMQVQISLWMGISFFTSSHGGAWTVTPMLCYPGIKIDPSPKSLEEHIWWNIMACVHTNRQERFMRFQIENKRHCSCEIDILANKLLHNIETLINFRQEAIRQGAHQWYSTNYHFVPASTRTLTWAACMGGICLNHWTMLSPWTSSYKELSL